jgi:hypothetical protein
LRTPFLFIFGSPQPKAIDMLIDLTSSELGILWDEQGVWRKASTDPNGRNIGTCSAALKDLHYNSIHTSNVSLKERLCWLAASAPVVRSREMGDPLTIAYLKGPPTPQAYDELASAFRKAGFDSEARRILFEKHSSILDSRRSSFRSSKQRWADAGLIVWGLGQKWLIGFGYRPARALFWLVGLWGLGTLAFWRLLRPIAVTAPGQKAPSSMSAWDHLTFPLHLLVPVANFTTSTWRPPNGWGVTIGAGLTVIGGLLLATVVTAVLRVAKRQ